MVEEILPATSAEPKLEVTIEEPKTKKKRVSKKAEPVEAKAKPKVEEVPTDVESEKLKSSEEIEARLEKKSTRSRRMLNEAKPVSDEEIEAKLKSREKEKKFKFDLKVFNKWTTNDVIVNDAGLKDYINLSPVLVPHTQGRNIKKQFWKSKKTIVERLICKIFSTGHLGKKHYRSSGHHTGKFVKVYNMLKETFTIVEGRTKKNPIQVFVDALENGTPKEGVATIEYGGVRYPKVADLSPQRRIDLALRWMTQGAFAVTSKNKDKPMAITLADEIVAAANKDETKSNCLKKKFELERLAAGNR